MHKQLDYYFQQLQQNKTEHTFRKIYQHSSVRLFGIILRILKDQQQAEDCLQETYIKIWNRIETYNPQKANYMTWIATIARNHAIDYVRKHKLPMAEDFEMNAIEDTQISTLHILAQNDTRRSLHNCLERLKPEAKNALFMAYFNGLTYQKIATITGTPISTIKTWVARALPILKQCLEADNVTK